MSFKLSENTKVKYSKGERKVFSIIATGAKKTSSEIIKAYYGAEVPFNGREIVIGMLRSLIKKVSFNKEGFKVNKSKRTGPIPMIFWTQKR